MKINFEKDYLRELYEKGKAQDKKHRFQPQVVKGYVKCVRVLYKARRIEDLFPFRSLNYEKLQGDKKGLSSVRINNQYRLEFREIASADDSAVIELATPFSPVHPGELIKDELECRQLSQKLVAERLGLPYTAFNEVLNGKRPVTTDLALVLEAALGIPAYILVGMQSDYNLQVAREDKKLAKRLAEIRKAAALL